MTINITLSPVEEQDLRDWLAEHNLSTHHVAELLKLRLIEELAK